MNENLLSSKTLDTDARGPNHAIFDSITQKNIDQWLEGNYDDTTKERLRELLINHPEQVTDAFFSNLTFGTAGLRGIMGVGTNRINLYTIRAATQGLANYLSKHPTDANFPLSVCVGFDSRHLSRDLAEETAKVLAGNGIKVYLFKEMRPSPLVSFTCRYKQCSSGIMITASHNPPSYNGYKVYWSDGGQLTPPRDHEVMNELNKVTDPSMVKMTNSLSHPLIELIDHEIDDAYLQAIAPLQNTPLDNETLGSNLKVVYTSLHGTGFTMIPKALFSWGFKNLSFVEKQMSPNGNFPTVDAPNPEDHAALKLGIDQLLDSQSDILIATDPDADRAAAVCLHQGVATVLTGSQIAALCVEHLCSSLIRRNQMPERAAFIKTIGTSELFKAICNAYQTHCCQVLTGFKYIAEKIHDWGMQPDGYHYIFGAEESYGYLLGTKCRDKDAIISSALICEIALQAKKNNKTLIDKLYDLFKKYGIYQEASLAVLFEASKNGKEQMDRCMQKFRLSAFRHINNVPIISVKDYLVSEEYWIQSGVTGPLSLPTANVLLYLLEDGTKVMIRPSGTEPKIKLYCEVVEKQYSSIESGIQTGSKRCENTLVFLKNELLKNRSEDSL